MEAPEEFILSEEHDRNGEIQGEDRPPVPAGSNAPSDVGGQWLQPQPNPDIERYEDFAASAKQGGVSYEKLIQFILSDALSLPDNGD